MMVRSPKEVSHMPLPPQCGRILLQHLSYLRVDAKFSHSSCPNLDEEKPRFFPVTESFVKAKTGRCLVNSSHPAIVSNNSHSRHTQKVMHSSSPSISMAPMGRRKRSYSKAGLFLASALSLSNTSGCNAFHSQKPFLSFHFTRPDRTVTKLGVVTDPKHIMHLNLDDRGGFDRRVLEDIYLIATTDEDGLSGDMVEGMPTKHISQTRSKSKIKNPRQGSRADMEELESTGSSRLQFKGLTTGPDGRVKRDSLSRIPPRPKSTISRSSTMPGFSDLARTDSMRAYTDGIKLAEQLSGRKFKDTAATREKRRAKNGEAMYKSSASVPESLVDFANKIHEIDRITPKEEVVLGEKTQEAVRLQKIYDTLQLSLAREPTDEEWCAAAGKINMEHLRQAIEEGLEAKNKLVTSNLRMVQGVVNVYIRNGLRGQYNAGDLMQEGVMALIRAAEMFDPTRGFRFSTYAMYWIRSSIKRGQVTQSRIVTVPQRLYENHKRVVKIRAELTKALGRIPTVSELADEVGISETQLERCLTAMAQRCYSLDQQIANPMKPNDMDKEDTMYDMIECKTDDGDYNSIKHRLLREDLISTLHRHLSEEEVRLLLLRYGLDDTSQQRVNNGPLTIAEVSLLAGYKPDKVRRIINRSLKHMKAVIGSEWIEYERELQ